MARTTNNKKNNAAATENNAQDPQKEEKAADMEAEKPVSEPEEEAEAVSRDKTEAEETDGTEHPETEEKVSEEEAGISVLVARAYILYNSRQYKPGEYLPANNPDMVAAWIDAGTATWDRKQANSVKASPVAATPGLAGAVSETVQMSGLVGRIS